MRRFVVAGMLAVMVMLCDGCNKPVAEIRQVEPLEPKDYGRPLPPGALALRKIDPDAYPDFGAGYYGQTGLREAIQHSLDYLAKPSSERYYPYGEISHRRAVASLERFLRLLDTAASPEALNQAIRAEFDVYESVGCDGQGTVFFSGYYCPIFEGRAFRDERFRYPLYGLPPDLVKDEEGRTLGQLTGDGSVDPRYPTRREIEEGRLLDGLEVAWLSDPFESYVITVQGSAKLRLGDGTLLELGYAGNNGHEYTPVSQAMVRDGVIGRGDISLQNLINYFRTHREQVYHYCWANERYVFFKPAPGGPFGSLNTPVTPLRTIATDKDVFPRGCLSFITTDIPTRYGSSIMQRPLRSFALDQDTGGAIRAAGRCDIFMGVGAEAEAVAGRTGAEGRLYYLFVREAAADSRARK